MPPLLSLHSHTYPPQITYDYHGNRFSSACLVVSGAMLFQERGCPPVVCQAGSMALLPLGCEYRWSIDRKTNTFQCLHGGFSTHNHGELALLFGVGQRQVASVAIGIRRTNAFVERMLSLRRRGALDILFSLAVLDLFADVSETARHTIAQRALFGNPTIERLVNHIGRNLHQELSILRLSRELNVCPSRLFLLSHKHLGVSPMQYVASRRIDEAKRLLASSDIPVGSIAKRLGFNSASYFIRLFKKHAHCTPLDLRRREHARVFGRLWT